MNKMRQIRPLPMVGVEKATAKGKMPRLMTVAPDELFIEESYQRGLSERSLKLIRHIVGHWDWAKMKPPICAMNDGKLFVIDGQHTALAAASHGGISKIPVMVVDTASIEARAQAFIGHNKDRVNITPSQIYYAELAAGDEIALAMAGAAERAGVKILKCPPSNGMFKESETIALASIRSAVTNKGINGCARILTTLAAAHRAPISSNEIKAVYALFYDKDWSGTFEDADLSTVIMSKPADVWTAHAESHVRKGMKMPAWRALAIDWYKAVPKKKEGCVMDLQARIDVLEEALENASVRIRELEDSLGFSYPVPLAFGLTGKEARVLGVIMSRHFATKNQIMAAVYSHIACDLEQPQVKIVDVFVCKMRKKLKKFGVDIQTVWGEGYSLSESDKKTINSMAAQERGKEAA